MPNPTLNELYTLCCTGRYEDAYWQLEEHFAAGALSVEVYADYKQTLREDFPEFREYAQEQ